MEVVGTVQQVQCIGGGYFEGDYSFMCVLSIKVPIRKMSGNLFNDPRNVNNLFTHSFLVSSIKMIKMVNLTNG